MTNIRVLVFGVLMGSLLFAGQGVAGEESFTIAVASDTQKVNGQISAVAARAHYFLFFDGDGNLFETIANPYADAPGRAGPRTANFLADKQVKVVVAGRFGTKMKNSLKEADIEHIEKQGKISEAIKGVVHAQ